jgi:hypothetical protein
MAPAMSTNVTVSPITQQAHRAVSGVIPRCSLQLYVTTTYPSGTEMHLRAYDGVYQVPFSISRDDVRTAAARSRAHHIPTQMTVAG